MSMSNKFKDTKSAKAYMLAGNARVTVVSLQTGTRFTFRIKRGKGQFAPHFVSVLTGSDNESDFTYLGTIFEGTKYVHGRKSPIRETAPSAKAFAWLWTTLHMLPYIPSNAECWHEGRCGRCARPLTVPSSIESGLGPECASKAA